MKAFQTDLYAYYGEGPAGEWIGDPDGFVLPGFVSAGTVSANLSKLSGSFHPQTAANGTIYYHIAFDVQISFGSNSLHAKLLWKDAQVALSVTTRVFATPPDSPPALQGSQREGPATIIPAPFR